jgi:hypothetical protein
MNAIPTNYNGINFRSRLEAKWARFFDLLGWKWDYEPVDFDGYIPDFYLHGDKPCFVEIKPAMRVSELITLNEQSYTAMQGTGKRMLYLGAAINITDPRCPYDGNEDCEFIGTMVDFLTEKDEDGDFVYEGDYAYFIDCYKCGGVSFTGVNLGWASHCCDAHTKHHSTVTDVCHLWKEATNTTQYKRIFQAGKG